MKEKIEIVSFRSEYTNSYPTSTGKPHPLPSDVKYAARKMIDGQYHYLHPYTLEWRQPLHRGDIDDMGRYTVKEIKDNLVRYASEITIVEVITDLERVLSKI